MHHVWLTPPLENIPNDTRHPHGRIEVRESSQPTARFEDEFSRGFGLVSDQFWVERLMGAN